MEQGRGLPQLHPNKPGQQSPSDQQQNQGEDSRRARLPQPGHRQHEGGEAGAVQQGGAQPEGRPPGHAHLPEREDPRRGHRQGGQEEQPEQAAPAEGVHQHAGHGGPHRRGEADHDAGEAQGPPLLLRRIEVEQDHLQNGDQHAGAAGLDGPGQEQHPERRGEQGQQAPARKEQKGHLQQHTGAHPLEQVGGQGGDHPQDQQVDGGEPLAHQGADLELRQDGGQGGGEHVLTQRAQEGPHHEHRDHPPVSALTHGARPPPCGGAAPARR